ncbi:MAG: cobyric acid synthase CobQ, partial [Chromatiaceae bacterium]
VHGIFDQPEACDALLAWAGYTAGGATDIAARRDADLDRLADAVETHLDTAPLAALFGLEEAGGH